MSEGEHSGSCGPCNGNPNPLDPCSRTLDHCDNPCNHAHVDPTKCGDPTAITANNSPQCESIISQIFNFSQQFFGPVTKVDDGTNHVIWQLPCDLDVGIPTNPRGAGEGLACYFVRLFQESLIVNQGPPGLPGENGANGLNAYAVTLAPFTQPTLLNPATQVLTSNNPAIIPEMFVYIDGSGLYKVEGNNGSGTLFLTLLVPADNPPITVPLGKLVVPSGAPGAQGLRGLQGIQGVKGDTGSQGAPGATGPQGAPGASSAYFAASYAPASSNTYNITDTYARVFTGGDGPTLILPTQGTYFITCTIPLVYTVLTNRTVNIKLHNLDSGADVLWSDVAVGGTANPGPANNQTYATITALHGTTGANQNVALFARTPGDSALDVFIPFTFCQMTAIRVS